jgi:hypothetical protein
MEEQEYNRKYINLRVLKSIQEYLKTDCVSPSVYPITVPEDLLIQALRLQGAENADKLIHHIFKLGLALWSEKLFKDEFGSQESLEDFIDTVKKRGQEENPALRERQPEH